MKYSFVLMKYFLVIMAWTSIIFSCTKEDDERAREQRPPEGDSLNITGTSPEYVYWDDTLTITGKGFSSNISDYLVRYKRFKYSDCNPGDTNSSILPVISANDSVLKVKVILSRTKDEYNHYCGPYYDHLIIKMKDKVDTTGEIKFTGWPQVGAITFKSYYQQDSISIAPADSIMLDLKGACGFSDYKNPNIYKNVQLQVDGYYVPISWIFRYGIYYYANIKLDPNHFARLKCKNDQDWGGGARKLLFTVTVPGTNRWDTVSHWVRWLPNVAVTGGRGFVSMTKRTPPSDLVWEIDGKHMYYKTAVFTAINETDPPITVNIVPNDGLLFYSVGKFIPPINKLKDGYKYRVTAQTHCGADTTTSLKLGEVTIYQ